jgi:hypothetical protein
MRFGLLAAVTLLAACAAAPRPPCNPTPEPGTLGSICGFENPEDVEAVPQAGLVLVSNMRPLGAGPPGGKLMALNVRGTTPRQLWPANGDVREPLIGDPTCTTPPADDTFSPHGINSIPSGVPGVVHVAVVHHGSRESIELFALLGSGDDAVLVWRGCVPYPPGVAGNDVAFAPDGELVASNFQPTFKGFRGAYYMMKGGLGLRTGDVIAWHAERGWRRLAGTAAPQPNGVAVSDDGNTVYYAQAGWGRVAALPRDGDPDGTALRSVKLPGHPDNLAWSPRGTLLVGVHTSGAKPLLCIFGRLPCRASWALVEIDPRTLEATERFRHDGDVVGAVASAAEIDGCTYFGSVFDDRIGVRCEPERKPE